MTHDITFPKVIADHGTEDMRLFTYQGKLMASFVNAKAVGGFFKAVVFYGELVKGEEGWSMPEPILLKGPANDFTAVVKNLAFFEQGSKLFCIWGINGGNQTTYQVIGNGIAATHTTTAPMWKWGQIRGGSMLPHKGRLLRFFHSRSGKDAKHRDFRYHVGALIMEATPPFEIIAVSDRPILSGNEEYMPGCKSWKRNCTLVFGAIKEGDGFKISVGLNDCRGAMIYLKEEDLNL